MEQRDYAVKVRLTSERRFRFLGPRGTVVLHRIHAVRFGEVHPAREVAESLVTDNSTVVAAKVVELRQGRSRDMCVFGEPSPDRVGIDFSQFRYLSNFNARTGRGYFHVRDAEGRYGQFDSAAYKACHAEAKAAGLDTSKLTVYAATCTFQTHGVNFIQQFN